MTQQLIADLIKASIRARENSYAPYSKFRVGAALLARNGEIYTGCNFENASFGAGSCAERVALGSAIAAGERVYTAICVCAERMVTPCGICRQALAEFGDIDVICCAPDETYTLYRLKDLLPDAFEL